MKCFSVSLAFCIVFSLVCHGAYGYDDVYTCVKEDNVRIALTFDDGPHYKYTEQILDILDKYNVKATFFVIGCNAEQRPDTVKEVYVRGHEIGNHTYSHPHLSSCSCEKLGKEIKKASDIICDITGQRPTLFRPPEGKCTPEVVNCARSNGYKVILWSIDTKDWSHPSSEKIVSEICKNVKGGDIILFHDFITPDTPTPQALDTIIPILQEKGFEFCRVSELIGA